LAIFGRRIYLLTSVLSRCGNHHEFSAEIRVVTWIYWNIISPEIEFWEVGELRFQNSVFASGI
jgi:hypothetical protein